jgi:outer membrane protein assembly factor BamD (BamD/ComL family)
MNKLILVLLSVLSLYSYGQGSWVDEPVLYEQAGGKSYLVRVDDALNKQDHKLVISLCDEIVKKSAQPANKAKALIMKGDAQVALLNDEDAFDTYQSTIDMYPVYIEYNDVVKKQLAIADREYDRVRGRDSMFLDRTPAITYYKKVITNSPFSDNSPALQLRVAILEMDDDKPEEAIETYRTLVTRYRTTAEAGYARVNLAQHYLNLLDKIEGDQRLIDEAKIQLILFTQQFSSHPMLSEAQRRLKQIYNIEAERLYLLAVFYNRTETPYYRPEAAKKYLYRLLIEYGDSDFVIPAQKLLATLDPDYKSNLVDEKEKIRLENERKRLLLPPEATDPSKRKILIPQGESDKYLLPIHDLDLKPLENEKNEEKKNENN